MNAPTICHGNRTCDSRIPHICYNGMDVTETPWEETDDSEQ